MSNMSRSATMEYIGQKRRAYSECSITKKSKLLDEVCCTTGLSRKHVNKLLTGQIRYREHPGRGKTYTDEQLCYLRKIWRAIGCPCTKYLKVQIDYWVDQYTQFIANIPQSVQQAICKMSASTMDRALKGVKREKPGTMRRNRRSGTNKRLQNAIECRNGEEIMAALVTPGDMQVDTVALCGGNPNDNFWWICTLTDRHTQWTEISPTWNRGSHNTIGAIDRMVKRTPFPVNEIHGDNGPEFINWALAFYVNKRRKFRLSRSRKFHKNDNAHVETKNGSVVRELFGEGRIDDPDLFDDLERLCQEWSDFCNFFRPSKMLVSREKRANSKGFSLKHDQPKTPFQRLIDARILSSEQIAKLQAKRNSLNGMELYQRLLRRLGRIRRKQEAFKEKHHRTKELFHILQVEDSVLRTGPSGTSSFLQYMDGTRLKKPKSYHKQQAESVKYLTNQKPPSQKSGVIST